MSDPFVLARPFATSLAVMGLLVVFAGLVFVAGSLLLSGDDYSPAGLAGQGISLIIMGLVMAIPRLWMRRPKPSATTTEDTEVQDD